MKVLFTQTSYFSKSCSREEKCIINAVFGGCWLTLVRLSNGNFFNWWSNWMFFDFYVWGPGEDKSKHASHVWNAYPSLYLIRYVRDIFIILLPLCLPVSSPRQATPTKVEKHKYYQLQPLVKAWCDVVNVVFQILAFCCTQIIQYSDHYALWLPHTVNYNCWIIGALNSSVNFMPFCLRAHVFYFWGKLTVWALKVASCDWLFELWMPKHP